MPPKTSRIIIGAAFVVLVSTAYLIVSTAGDGSIPPSALHAPSARPDRVLLTLCDDPATSRTVTWRTDLSVSQPFAQIAAAEDGPDFRKNVSPVKPVSQTLDSDLGSAMYHTARFTGLTPGVQYVYRVGGGAKWSEWNQFRTSAAGPKRLKFIYFGDAQNDLYEMWSRLVRQGYTSAPDADFLIHAGDLVNKGNSDSEWGEWFAAAGWITRTIPSLATPGNHEYPKNPIGSRSLSDHWIPQFGLPENGLPGLEETSYYVDIQGVRMVSLNSNVRRAEQAAWLDDLLSDNPNRWTILAFHHPIYSSAEDRDNKGLREAWQPVIDKHKVDLVLQGHDHTYGRSNLMRGVNARDGAHGTVYVVSVSGPKMYQIGKQEWMERVAERTQLFQVIEIEGNLLQYEARTARGLLYDAFELRKNGDGPNELVNKPAQVPVRIDDGNSGE